MKRILFTTFLTCVCLGFFASCDALEDAASVKVNVDPFTVTMSATQLSQVAEAKMGPATRAASPYVASYTLNKTDPRFAEAAEYASNIVKVGVSNCSVKITCGSLTNAATGIKFSATGISSAFTIPSYSLGQTYTPPSNDASLNSLVVGAIMKMYSSGSVTFNFECSTDVPAGSTLNVQLNIGPSVHTFNVLK